MCFQSYWWRHSKKNYIFSQNISIFAWIFPAPSRLNYESILNRGEGIQISFPPKKWLARKYQKQSQDLFFGKGETQNLLMVSVGIEIEHRLKMGSY